MGAALHKLIKVQPERKGLHDVTELVLDAIESLRAQEGMVTVFVQHTSASLIIQENADPAVLRDLEHWLDKAVPESDSYEHQEEGPDDMPAHIKGAITASHVAIPLIEGKLALGVWQGIFLWEHRTIPRARSLVVHVS